MIFQGYCDGCGGYGDVWKIASGHKVCSEVCHYIVHPEPENT